MTNQKHFRILTPEGGLSTDTFVLPPRQPPDIKAGCTAVINERSGILLTVYDTRLFPAEAGVPAVADVPNNACWKYDRVQGVIEVRLSCPDHGGSLRRAMQANETPPAHTMPILAPIDGLSREPRGATSARPSLAPKKSALKSLARRLLFPFMTIAPCDAGKPP